MILDRSVKIDQLSSRFAQIELVGKGSYGKVTKCLDKELKKIVALKKIIDLKERANFETRLLHEIEILSKLNHPNIVKLYNVFYVKSEDCFYLELEYCQHDLYGLIEAQALSVEQVKSIMRQILCALEYLNKNNILHRDIKPLNILIKDCDTVKIADFGFAKQQKNYGSSNIITLCYRPLELLLGQTEYGSEVDIWSTAVTFYQLMTGKNIFHPYDNLDAMISSIISVCGTPNADKWPELKTLPGYDKILSMKSVPSKIENKFDSTIRENYGPIVDQMLKMFSLDPKKRPTAEELLKSGAFNDEKLCPITAVEIHMKTFVEKSPSQNNARLPIARPVMPVPVLSLN